MLIGCYTRCNLEVKYYWTIFTLISLFISLIAFVNHFCLRSSTLSNINNVKMILTFGIISRREIRVKLHFAVNKLLRGIFIADWGSSSKCNVEALRLGLVN